MRSFLRIWSHLLKKPLIETFIYCEMVVAVIQPMLLSSQSVFPTITTITFIVTAFATAVTFTTKIITTTTVTIITTATTVVIIFNPIITRSTVANNSNNKTHNDQKQPSRDVLGKRCSEKCSKLTGEHLCRSVISIKL